tara:strand:- start:4176 stop:4538 length:363 start_codon:yes stop_codon:yes gene_type:complete
MAVVGMTNKLQAGLFTMAADKKRQLADSSSANRVNTMPAISALVKAMGGSLRQSAKIMGANYATLWRQKEAKKNPPSLDALILYANRVYNRTGIAMVVTVTPDMNLIYSITDGYEDGESS